MAVVLMRGVPRHPVLLPKGRAPALGWWLWPLGARRASETRAHKICGARTMARARDARGKTHVPDVLQEPLDNMRRDALSVRVFACCGPPRPSVPVVRGFGTAAEQ